MVATHFFRRLIIGDGVKLRTRLVEFATRHNENACGDDHGKRDQKRNINGLKLAWAHPVHAFNMSLKWPARNRFLQSYGALL